MGRVLSLAFVCLVSGMTATAQPTHLPLAEVAGDPSAIVAGCVNIVTGTYTAGSVDLVIPGAQPVLFQRLYSSMDWKGQGLSDGWSHNYISGLANLSADGRKYAISIPEPSGGALLYKSDVFAKTRKSEKGEPNGIYAPASAFLSASSTFHDSGLTNTATGEIGGATNLKNQICNYHSPNAIATVTLCDGGQRVFRRLQRALVCPVYFRADEEILPNGNRILYEYNGSDLRAIRVTDSSGQRIYGSLDISTMQNGIKTVIANDGQNAKYEMHSSQGRNYVRRATHPNGPVETFHYSGHKDYSSFRDQEKIVKRELPEGRYQTVAYYFEGMNDVQGDRVLVKTAAKDGNHVGRVKLLQSPVGSNNAAITTHRFYYHFTYHGDDRVHYQNGSHVDVRDALDRRTTYQLLFGQRLGSIDRYANNSLYSRERFYWGDRNNKQQCNLICKSLEDADGSIRSCRYLEYDQNHNVVAEHVLGNLSGNNALPIQLSIAGIPTFNGCECFTMRYAYSNDRYNLRTCETYPNGKSIEYAYLPNTNLLTTKITKDHGHIVQREFTFYDSFNVVQRTIVDDGSGSHSDDLSNVTNRRITYYQTRQHAPAIGLPEVITECYMDPKSHEEHQLTRKINHYSKEGRLQHQHVFDANNVLAYTLEWQYDQMGNVIQETDPLGHLVTRRFDANGNKVYEQRPTLDHHFEFAYDHANRLISETRVTKDRFFITSYKYDVCNQLVSSVDHFGNEISYEYDDLGRQIKTVLPAHADSSGSLVRSTLEQEYDIANHVTSKKDVDGGVTQTSYNIRGQPVCITQPDGSQKRYEYNLDGSLRKEIASNGTYIIYLRDSLNNAITTETIAADHQPLCITSATYKGNLITSETDANGNVTTYDYDGAGRLRCVAGPFSRTQHDYDSLGRPYKTTQSYGHEDQVRVTIKEYDLLDRILEERVEAADGNIFTRKTYQYDASGNVVCATTFGQNGPEHTFNTYNALGQVTKVTDALGHETITEYNFDHINDHGQKVLQTRTIDSLGNQTLTTYNALGHSVAVARLNSSGDETARIDNVCNAKGRVLKRTDSVKIDGIPLRFYITEWRYDVSGHVVELIEACNSGAERHSYYLYNSNAQKEADILPDSTVIRYQYDLQNRLKRFYDSKGTFCYEYSYDLNGNLVQVDDEIHQLTTHRSYDQENRLLSEQLANELTVSYGYDRLGRMISLTLPDQSSITYGYDSAFLRSIYRNGYTHSYMSFDPSGRLLASSLVGAGNLTYWYDKLGRKLHCRTDHFSETIPSDGYDSVGNLLHKFRHDPLGDVDCRYRYDSLYQLTHEQGMASHDYCYDSLNNRLSIDQSDSELDALNQLLHQGELQFTYDVNGNRSSRGFADSSTTYSYDSLGRLTDVHKGDDHYQYVYDSFNRRIKKINRSSGATERYLYQGHSEIGMVDDSGSLVQLRILGLGHGAEIGAAVAIEMDKHVFVPVHDTSGHIAVLLDVAGHILETCRYSAFGEEFSPSSPFLPWRFSCKRFDPETSLLNFGRRYYDPEVARWLTPDPRGYDDGPNLYAYVHNRPLTHHDLWGLYSSERCKRDAQDYGRGVHNAAVSPSDTLDRWGRYCREGWQAVRTGDFSSIRSRWEALGRERQQRFVNQRAGEATLMIVSILPAGRIVTRASVYGFAAYDRFIRSSQALKEPPSPSPASAVADNGTVAVPEASRNLEQVVGEVSGTTRMRPDPKATGAHSVWRRNGSTGEITKYEEWMPQTNPQNPNAWQSVKRYDGGPHGEGHFNKATQEYVLEPHVHDPCTPGGVRAAEQWEIPKGGA
ncbi:MAG: RHS repeat-associated core domain-containing protein [Chlamydiales bacterium]|nr:RHS repeat-associated core domain-containing protein [Chlamydiales bacterium]